MQPIGGYLSLELSKGIGFMHSDGCLLASCRNAIELILAHLAPVVKIWIPYYTCEVVLEPINRLKIKYQFYHINKDLEIADKIELKENEVLLYTNYFGIKDAYIHEIAKKYGCRLIVDNAQALYATHIEGTNTAYSPRKFIGIPDGGIAYFHDDFKCNVKVKDESYDRCSHLLKRIDVNPSFGYQDFRENANKLQGLPVSYMSQLTEKLMLSVNFDVVKDVRNKNFAYLNKFFGDKNYLKLPSQDSFQCPLVYPYWAKNSKLKEFLIENQIFVATYWPNVLKWCRETDLEYKLANEIIFLPIDQRYNIEDMDYIINVINNAS